jgi:chromosome partitioning protein
VLADFLSFHGLKLLFEQVQQIEEDLEYQLENAFIAVNAYNQTFKIAREALDALKKHYSEYLLKSVVRQCTKFAQASSEGVPVFAFDPESKGATDIQAMIDEIMAKLLPAAAPAPTPPAAKPPSPPKPTVAAVAPVEAVETAPKAPAKSATPERAAPKRASAK